jgi:hypothetical protein
MQSPLEKGGSCHQHEPNPHKLTVTRSIGNSETATTQASAHKNQERELGLIWLASKSLVEINEKLTDAITLLQQQTDLLRAIRLEHEGRRR